MHELDLKRINGWPTYSYVIDYYSKHLMDKDSVVHGAYHGSELRYLFNPNFMAAFLKPDDLKFQGILIESIVNFIKIGLV